MNGLDHLPSKDGFRLRGTQMTRLETFADAAFAFAVTVLVIAGGEIPDSFEALLRSLHDIPAFGASFAIILLFWSGHLRWSRRLGLEDGLSIFLSGLLIFVILIYVVPLKVLFAQMFAFFSKGRIGTPFDMRDPHQLTQLFVIYGLGYASMAGTLALLNLHGLRRAESLELNGRERLMIRTEIGQWVLSGSPGLLSALFAAIAPVRWGVWAGFLYMTLPIIMPVFGIVADRRLRSFESSTNGPMD